VPSALQALDGTGPIRSKADPGCPAPQTAGPGRHFLRSFRAWRLQGLPCDDSTPDKSQQILIVSIGAAVAGHRSMHRGFSLIEVLVAMAVMSTATIAIAQLSIVSVRLNRVARSTTVATVLALQKMEQLQSAAWTELAPSPSGALGQNSAGYCDFLDGNGRMLGNGTSPPAGAVFVRRWSIEPLAAGGALAIQVSLTPVGAARLVGATRHPEEARIVGIKTRR
jgi:prepilin-type N-terminal cleavage/methylation domain-containing protein